MKITKRKLKQIIAEEKRSLAENFNKLQDFTIKLVVRVPERSVRYVYDSIEDGMQFDQESGEGIIDYQVLKSTPFNESRMTGAIGNNPPVQLTDLQLAFIRHCAGAYVEVGLDDMFGEYPSRDQIMEIMQLTKLGT